MRKYWLLFAQAVTVALAVLFVVVLFKPELLRWQPRISTDGLTIRQVAGGSPAGSTASFAEASKRAVPAVVNVFTKKQMRGTRSPLLDDPVFRHFFGERFDPRPQEVSNLGSGVIVSANGYILTNHHVVEGADEIQIALSDGRTLPAKVVGTDPETDLAVLKINAVNLPAITFAQPDSLRVGDWVLAIGNPFGVGQTVTLGIVSALGRSHLGINTFENFIQTDAAINPGNSGGALVDTEGRLVGINTAIYSRSGGSLGIGFAIPVDAVRTVMEALLREGQVTRGWIGVEPRDLTPELAASLRLPFAQGVLITGVLQDGPASRAGMRPGDVVLAIGGAEVGNSAQLLAAVAALKPHSVAAVSVQRGAQTLQLSLNVAQRPKMQRRAAE
jgi:serine protease DegQ